MNPDPFFLPTMRFAFLVSGNGGFAKAVYRNMNLLMGAQLVAVVADRECGAAQYFAENTAIPTSVFPTKEKTPRKEFEEKVVNFFKAQEVNTLFLTFDRLISDTLLQAYPGKIFNLHPALLPMFPGCHALSRAWESSTLFSGVTVHLVDAGVDSGPIVSQVCVSKKMDESEADFIHRIFCNGAILLIDTIRKLAIKKSQMKEGQFRFEDVEYGTVPFNPALSIGLDQFKFWED
ncbi:MAG TPA: formyltransferase family protein [Candidatus Sumerlaeota bacterium]|nr:formyltransferase family protein [Candidatus Sumerlaeota bacterium]